jgi:hypothetical protein
MPVSVLCSMLISMFLIGALRAIRLDGLISRLNFDAWYEPLVWGPGLLFGFFVNRRTLQRAACFVWFSGLLWLAWGILSIASGWRPDGVSPMTEVRIELFPRKQGECGMTECLGLLFYVWPAVNSVAYSIGASIALLSKPRRIDAEEPSTEYTTLGLD